MRRHEPAEDKMYGKFIKCVKELAIRVRMNAIKINVVNKLGVHMWMKFINITEDLMDRVWMHAAKIDVLNKLGFRMRIKFITLMDNPGRSGDWISYILFLIPFMPLPTWLLLILGAGVIFLFRRRK